MKHSNLLSVAAVCLAATSSSAVAQSRQVPAPPQEQPVLIHSATIHPVVGDPIQNGHVLFDRGVIRSIGSGQPGGDSARGAIRLDGSDLHVYPGLFAPMTQLGLTETGAVEVTQDYSELGRMTPEVRAAVAINPDSDLIPVTRENGILLSGVFPQGGLVTGRAAVIRLDGWTWESMAINDDAGLCVNWPRTEPINAWWMDKSDEEQRKEIAEDLENLEDFFDEAEAYVAAKDNDPEMTTDLRFEAMRPALDGTKPMFVRAASAGQIESAVAWSTRRSYDIVIVGGNEADEVIPLLKKHDVPVIINGLHRLPPHRDSRVSQPFELPNKLYEAGVRFAIASGAETPHERHLNHNGAMAAAYGLPKSEALRAVTLYPAQIFEVDGKYGSLERGKSATLIVTTGDPLEIMTDTLVAFIDGRRIDMGNRQETLYRKYRKKYAQLGILDPEPPTETRVLREN